MRVGSRRSDYTGHYGGLTLNYRVGLSLLQLWLWLLLLSQRGQQLIGQHTAWYGIAWYGMRDTEYNTVHCRALYSMQMSVEERDRGRE
jgi:hypothetical protein